MSAADCIGILLVILLISLDSRRMERRRKRKDDARHHRHTIMGQAGEDIHAGDAVAMDKNGLFTRANSTDHDPRPPPPNHH